MSTTTATPRRRKGAAPIIFIVGAVLLALILVSALAPRAWKAGDTESAAGPTAATAEPAGPIVTGGTSTLEDEIIGDVSTGNRVLVHKLSVELPDGGTETWEVSDATWSTCTAGDTATRDATTGLVTCT
ncbi:MAG: hypothetical protein ACTMKY_00825 [Dermabacteraceae bacterium]|uniref:hypothetical protein n=1 Tax=Brachybacterium TaxID=43668 RepID=UPI003F8DBB82